MLNYLSFTQPSIPNPPFQTPNPSISTEALSPKELCMVCMAGCMRGTIAYALILRAVPPEDEQSHVDRIMVTTVWGPWVVVTKGGGNKGLGRNGPYKGINGTLGNQWDFIGNPGIL